MMMMTTLYSTTFFILRGYRLTLITTPVLRIRTYTSSSFLDSFMSNLSLPPSLGNTNKMINLRIWVDNSIQRFSVETSGFTFTNAVNKTINDILAVEGSDVTISVSIANIIPNSGYIKHKPLDDKIIFDDTSKQMLSIIKTLRPLTFNYPELTNIIKNIHGINNKIILISSKYTWGNVIDTMNITAQKTHDQEILTHLMKVVKSDRPNIKFKEPFFCYSVCISNVTLNSNKENVFDCFVNTTSEQLSNAISKNEKPSKKKKVKKQNLDDIFNDKSPL